MIITKLSRCYNAASGTSIIEGRYDPIIEYYTAIKNRFEGCICGNALEIDGEHPLIKIRDDKINRISTIITDLEYVKKQYILAAWEERKKDLQELKTYLQGEMGKYSQDMNCIDDTSSTLYYNLSQTYNSLGKTLEEVETEYQNVLTKMSEYQGNS